VTIRGDLDVLESQGRCRVERVANGAYALIDDYDTIMIEGTALDWL
jgi:DeoR/GlpR family transcriptional regulator of sugar metabolism